jgi:hypothetical protein
MVVLAGVSVSTFADASPAERFDPVTTKPDATQVEPEVLAALRAAETKAAAEGVPVDEKSETIAENLGNPDVTPAASVSGVVANANGVPMRGADVVLMDTDGNLMAQTLTDASGKYRITSVQSGPYVIQVLPSAGDSSRWARTWYPADPSFLRADVVNVPDAGATANVSVQRGASLGVKVATGGRSLSGATVQVCGESFLDCQAGKADSKGKIALSGVPLSSLRISVTTVAGDRYEFTSAVTSPGATTVTLDTLNGKLVAKGKS